MACHRGRGVRQSRTRSHLNLLPAGGSKGQAIDASRFSHCPYSILAVTDGKPSFANDPLRWSRRRNLAQGFDFRRL